MKTSARLLVVEDERITAADLAQQLGQLGYTVVGTAATAEQAIALAGEFQPDLVLMDITLASAADGVSAAAAIRERFDLPVVYLTAHSDEPTLERARETTPFGYILKPFEATRVHVTIQMALYHHAAERRMREVAEWLTGAVESLGDAVLVTDLDGRVTYLNPQAEQLLGWKLAEAQGRPLHETCPLTNAQGLPYEPLAHAHDAIGRMAFTRNLSLKPREGAVIPLDVVAAPLRHSHQNNKLAGWTLTLRETAVTAESTGLLREVSAFQQDLKNVHYSLHHTLRTPLVQIGGFIELLARRHGEQLPAEAREFIDIIRESTHSLEACYKDMQHYFSIVERPFQGQAVDLAALVHEVWEKLAPQREGRAIGFRAGTLPACEGDPLLMREIFHQLLGNAIKSTQSQASAQIEVGSETTPEGTAYYVRDNGTGFDPQHVSRLFLPFGRLQPQGEGEGHGIGLACARRAAERHGGKIWVETQAGHGATFRFTLRTAASSATALPKAV